MANKHPSKRRKNIEVFKDHAKVAAMLGQGMTTHQVSKATGYTADSIGHMRPKIMNDPELRETFRLAKLQAAQEIIPLATKATIKSIQRGIDALDNGIQQSAGINKETGQAVMVTVKPNLQQISAFAREAAYITGVGKGGTLSSDDEIHAQAMAQTVASKLNWNDPAVLEQAMRIAGGIANAPPRLPSGEEPE